MELVADWFAAAAAYEGKWPVAGAWPWLERRYKHYANEIHWANVLFLSGLLTGLGFERCIMASLHGDDTRRFDWGQALGKLETLPQMQQRFAVLMNHFTAPRAKSN